MKYLITKTDISINGNVLSEGSVIDSDDFSKQDIESVKHLLVPVDKGSDKAITLASDDKQSSEVKTVSKRGRKNHNEN